jgi:DNA-directed RNA polymerase subunit alpha
LVDLKSKNWRELIKPKRVEIDQGSSTNSYGKFTCEPLSSLQGAAIVSVKFDGVLHEFSAIPGVFEDVTDIILNLKEIKLRLVDAEEAVVHISREEEGKVTAGDIETHGLVEILNPDQHIATLNKEAKLNMEMVVKTGKSYVPAERINAKDKVIGVIPMDATML